MVAVVLSNRKGRLLPIKRSLHRGQRPGDPLLQGVFKGGTTSTEKVTAVPHLSFLARK